jgi:hypothetical protein
MRDLILCQLNFSLPWLCTGLVRADAARAHQIANLSIMASVVIVTFLVMLLCYRYLDLWDVISDSINIINGRTVAEVTFSGYLLTRELMDMRGTGDLVRKQTFTSYNKP